jgi:hypothetical protein
LVVRLGLGAPHTEFQLPNLHTKTLPSCPFPSVRHAHPLNLSSLLHKSQHFTFISALSRCLPPAASSYRCIKIHALPQAPPQGTRPARVLIDSTRTPDPSVRTAPRHQRRKATMLPSPIIYSPPSPLLVVIISGFPYRRTNTHTIPQVPPQGTRPARVSIDSTRTPLTHQSASLHVTIVAPLPRSLFSP